MQLPVGRHAVRLLTDKKLRNASSCATGQVNRRPLLHGYTPDLKPFVGWPVGRANGLLAGREGQGRRPAASQQAAAASMAEVCRHCCALLGCIVHSLFGSSLPDCSLPSVLKHNRLLGTGPCGGSPCRNRCPLDASELGHCLRQNGTLLGVLRRCDCPHSGSLWTSRRLLDGRSVCTTYRTHLGSTTSRSKSANHSSMVQVTVRVAFGATIREGSTVQELVVEAGPDDSVLDLKQRVAAAAGGSVTADDLLLEFGPNDRRLGRQYDKDPSVDESKLKLSEYSLLAWLERFPHWRVTGKNKLQDEGGACLCLHLHAGDVHLLG